LPIRWQALSRPGEESAVVEVHRGDRWDGGVGYHQHAVVGGQETEAIRAAVIADLAEVGST
jgi:hypothetical protein